MTKEQKLVRLRNLQNILLEASGLNKPVTGRERMVEDRQDAEFWEAVNEATHKEFPDE